MTAKQRAALRTLNGDIADMISTAVRIGERDGWDSPLNRAISIDIAKWRQKRDRLLRRAA
jgi:hypothetical protein